MNKDQVRVLWKLILRGDKSLSMCDTHEIPWVICNCPDYDVYDEDISVILDLIEKYVSE